MLVSMNMSKNGKVTHEESCNARASAPDARGDTPAPYGRLARSIGLEQRNWTENSFVRCTKSCAASQERAGIELGP
jgi:hypothetical protein